MYDYTQKFRVNDKVAEVCCRALFADEPRFGSTTESVWLRTMSKVIRRQAETPGVWRCPSGVANLDVASIFADVGSVNVFRHIWEPHLKTLVAPRGKGL